MFFCFFVCILHSPSALYSYHILALLSNHPLSSPGSCPDLVSGVFGGSPRFDLPVTSREEICPRVKARGRLTSRRMTPARRSRTLNEIRTPSGTSPGRRCTQDDSIALCVISAAVQRNSEVLKKLSPYGIMWRYQIHLGGWWNW